MGQEVPLKKFTLLLLTLVLLLMGLLHCHRTSPSSVPRGSCSNDSPMTAEVRDHQKISAITIPTILGPVWYFGTLLPGTSLVLA